MILTEGRQFDYWKELFSKTFEFIVGPTQSVNRHSGIFSQGQSGRALS